MDTQNQRRVRDSMQPPVSTFRPLHGSYLEILVVYVGEGEAMRVVRGGFKAERS